ncbi:MAG: hypothetical protein WCP12_15240, partial [bacterium]
AYRRPRLYTGPAAAGPAIDTTLPPTQRLPPTRCLRRTRRRTGRCTGEDAYTPRGCNESQMRPLLMV